MKDVDRAGFLAALEQARVGGSFQELHLVGAEDLRGLDFSHVDCQWLWLENCDLSRCNFDGAVLDNGKLPGCILRGATFRGASVQGVDFRRADLTGCDISGANMRSSWLEGARLDGVIHDQNTRYFRMRCPESGAFIGYKKCFGDRVVMLLIPADAKRVSGTNDACRCSKAKVLTITSFDFTERFEWANSLVDENFVYRVGQVVTPDRFTEDRWCDSTYGIHFWMEREQAIAY